MHGREIKITALGKTWRLARFSVEIRQQWIEWAKTQLPDPFEGLADVVKEFREKGLDDCADLVFNEAMERRKKRGALNDPEILAILKSQEGAFQALVLCLRKYHPDLSLDEALEVLAAIEREHGEKEFEKLHPELEGKFNLTEEQVEADFFCRAGNDAEARGGTCFPSATHQARN